MEIVIAVWVKHRTEENTYTLHYLDPNTGIPGHTLEYLVEADDNGKFIGWDNTNPLSPVIVCGPCEYVTDAQTITYGIWRQKTLQRLQRNKRLLAALEEVPRL